MNEKFFGNKLFESNSPDELKELELDIIECPYDPGEIVFEDGDPGEHIYLVAEGSVTISKRGRGGRQETLAHVEQGDFFGEMAVIDRQNRSARATAGSPTLLGRLSRGELDRYLAHSPRTARHFARLITQQLRDANSKFIEELVSSERLSLLGTMMGSIIHDIRNPISTIGIVADYLERSDDPRLAEMGSLTQEAVDTVQDMIQELLDYSKGVTRLDLKPTQIDDLISSLDRLILARLKGSGIEVRKEISWRGEFMADGHRLKRLLVNIIKNSWEAMPQNREGTLILRVLSEDGETVRFEVEDNGCGIKPDILAKIFEPFVTDGKVGGTGLGMSIAKSVVEAHHGKIWLESEVGKGTCCRIELPLVVPSPEKTPVLTAGVPQ